MSYRKPQKRRGKFSMPRYTNVLLRDFSKAKTTSDKTGVFLRGFRTLKKARHFADADDQQLLSDTLVGVRAALKERHGVKGLPKVG